MKLNSILYSKGPKKIAVVLAITGITLLFNACKKDDHYTPSIAALSVVNASPSLDSLNFYIEGQRVNDSALVFGGKIEYQRVFQGIRGTAVKKAKSHDVLLAKAIALQGGEYHSLYITGVDTLDYVFLKDDLSDPAASKAKVRFLNLSPDAPSLNLEIEGDTTTFSDRAYKAHTPFKNVNGAKSTIILKNKATDAELARLTNVDLKSGKIYTIWAKGLIHTTVDSLKLSIKVTNQGN